MTAPVLVIADDDPDMRALVRDTLASELADVVEVADGRELFWHLMRAEYAGAPARGMVIVTDVRMPAYDGLDVLDAWQEARPGEPVVVITAFPDDKVRARVARLGGCLLAKPFTRAALRQAVARATARRAGQEA